MTMRYIYTILFITLLYPFSGYSQITRLKHGDRLYDKYEFINAQNVYKKVIDKGYASAQIYSDLAESYYFQSNYNEAAVWYDKLITNYFEEVSEMDYMRAIQSFKSIEQYDRADELLKGFTNKFGKTTVSIRYDADPNYLESIKGMESDYTLKELAVNVPGSNHSPAFYDKNKIVYSSQAIENVLNTHDWDGSTFLDLFIVDRDTIDGWLGNKRPLKGDVNSPLHESAAVFTKDGQTMYFTRNNIVDGKKRKDRSDVIRLRIFKAERQGDDTWNVVEDLPINDDSYSNAYPALNAAEDKLYFSSDRDGTFGMSDIWYVDINEDGTYGEAVHLGAGVNTDGREGFLFIDSNDMLYFASDGHLGLGGLDIFKTQLDKDGMPSRIVENLGEPFNSPQDDFALIIEPEKERGYLTSNRAGGGTENDNIYYFYRECSMVLEGRVLDQETGDPLVSGVVRVLDENNKFVVEDEVGIDGSYHFEVECDTEYIIQVIKDGYTIEESVIHTPSSSGKISQDVELEVDGPCAPDDLGCRLALQPIYFDFDKDDIRPDAEIELAKILEAMKMYPELVIHIESHTDSRGDDNYNLNLSERRAQSTRDWLINEGINPDRLTAKGYGETRLVNHCSNDVPCTAEEHQLNRRSMFIIQD